MIDENWQDFVDNMDFVGAKVIVVDENKMVEYKSVRNSIIKARHAAKSVHHYLEETMLYESERLDKAYDLIVSVLTELEDFE